MKSVLRNINKTLICIFIICMVNTVYGDSIISLDKSVIEGKIIEEKGTYYLIANEKGTFKVLKKNIKDIYRTKAYGDNIEVQKIYFVRDPKLSKNITKAPIIKRRKKLNLKEVENKKDKKEKKIHLDYWDYGRIHVSGTYFNTFLSNTRQELESHKRISNGFGCELAYEQGLNFLIKKPTKSEGVSKEKKKRIVPRFPELMPGVRVELGYINFAKDIEKDHSRTVTGFTLAVGPMWAFPYPHNYWGCIIVSGEVGITFLEITNRETEEKRKSNPFIFIGILGYEYAFQHSVSSKRIVSLVFHFRYTYIYDALVAFHGVGFSLGLSIRLW